MTTAYVPRRTARSESVPVRGLHYHVHAWGEPSPDAVPLVLLHGWMDVGASYQFVVDAMAASRWVVAPDWRGFGRSTAPRADSYWFPDYLADLDALLDALAPGRPVDLAGHSMGGNVVMLYAGVRPERVRRLINLEGFGLPDSRPHQAPRRLRQWLDELRTPMALRPYDTLDAVAARLLKNNPRLAPDKAAWLAPHWAERRDDGLWHILGDPAHKRVNPVPYRKDEALECWKLITAPVLWVEGALTDMARWWGDRYPREEFEQRLAAVPHLERERIADSGHMLHLDQPRAVAAAIERFVAG